MFAPGHVDQRQVDDHANFDLFVCGDLGDLSCWCCSCGTSSVVVVVAVFFGTCGASSRLVLAGFSSLHPGVV